MQKNEFVEVQITDMTKQGEGIGRFLGCTLFVKGALPGDLVRARITRPKKNYAYARAEEILVPSADRVEAPCPINGPCGGCTLQALRYEKQCAQKEKIVLQNLTHIGGFAEETLQAIARPILSANEIYRYRNKAQYPVGERIGEDGSSHLVAGYFAARTHSLIPLADCLLSPAHHKLLLQTILSFGDAHGWRAYDEKSGRGLLRHILVRDGFASGEIMICFVINGKNLPGEEVLADSLRALPQIGACITSICKSINTKNTNVILGEEVRPIFGPTHISDVLGGLHFRISPQSFYQVDHAQTERLYAKVKEYAALSGTEEVLDLFCGIGTISLYLADAAKHVTGIEIVPQAIKDAGENARANGITNADFYAGAAQELIASGKIRRPDVVVLDPPRKGCAEKLLSELRILAPEKIIYVSCDSATLSRDLKILSDKNTTDIAAYELREVQPIDLFPHSCHCECVCLMSRVNC